jgi:hypothetical protein
MFVYWVVLVILRRYQTTEPPPLQSDTCPFCGPPHVASSFLLICVRSLPRKNINKLHMRRRAHYRTTSSHVGVRQETSLAAICSSRVPGCSSAASCRLLEAPPLGNCSTAAAGCSSAVGRLQLRRQEIAAPPPLVAARPAVDCSSAVRLLQLRCWLQIRWESQLRRHMVAAPTRLVAAPTRLVAAPPSSECNSADRWLQLRRRSLQLRRQMVVAPSVVHCSSADRRV